MATSSPVRHEERILNALLLLTRGARDSPLEQLGSGEPEREPEQDLESLERVVTIGEWGARVRSQVPRLWREGRTALRASEAPTKQDR